MIYEPNKKIIMKKYIIPLLCSQLTAHSSLLSQNIFISKGKIEFEKRVNIYKNIDDQRDNDDQGGESDWINQIKKQMPEFNVTYFNLFFEGDKTLYKPGREITTAQKIPDWFKGPASDNVVY